MKKELLTWLATSKILNFPRNLLLKIIFKGVEMVWSAKNHYEKEFLEVRSLIKRIKRKLKCY